VEKKVYNLQRRIFVSSSTDNLRVILKGEETRYLVGAVCLEMNTYGSEVERSMVTPTPTITFTHPGAE